MQLVLVRGGDRWPWSAIVITLFANQNRNTNPFQTIQGIPWAADDPDHADDPLHDRAHQDARGAGTSTPPAATPRPPAAPASTCATSRSPRSRSAPAFGALGGIFLRRRSTGGAQLDLGSGNILLFSVAAAVIGGTSLFGGRGKPRDAIIGALVIAIIPNGLGLKPSLGAQCQQVITGVVLLLAAAVDALSRPALRCEPLTRPLPDGSSVSGRATT